MAIKKTSYLHMNKPIDMRALVPAVFFLIAALFSCTKPENIIGTEVQPEEGLLNASRLIVPMNTGVIGPRAVPSDEAFANLAGRYNDPAFGMTSASFSAQFRLSAAWDTIPPAALSLDSIVLSLRLLSVYNNALITPPTPISLGVYELSEAIFLDSTYFTNTTIQTFPTKIGEKANFIPVVADTVIRISLDNNFGQRFLNVSNTDTLRTNENFVRFFKGLQIRPEHTPGTNEGSIVSFTRAASAITVYYKHNGVTLQNRFIVDNNSATINHFDFNYTGTPVGAALASTQQNLERVYIQGMGGVNTTVRIPALRSLLPEGNIVINKASLIIPVDLSVPGFLPPNQIFAVQFDSVRGITLPIPDILLGDAYFGGSYNASTNEYRINIARYIQANLTNPAINQLYLFPGSPAANPNRVILRGGAADENPIRLEIIYTNP
jgi:hypothetical protein